MQNPVQLITQQRVASLNDVHGFVESDDDGKIILRIVSHTESGYLKKAYEPGIRQFASFDAVVKLGAKLKIKRLEINPPLLRIA